MIELQITGRFEELIAIYLIMGATVGFITVFSFIYLYRMNVPMILKMFRARFFYSQWINEDNSITRKPIRVSQVKYGVIKYNKKPYMPSNTPFMFDNRPLYVFHHGHPMPITVMEYSKNVIVDGHTLKTKDLYFAPNKQTEDSKKLQILMNTKIIEDINKVPIDKFAIISMILIICAMGLSGGALAYITQEIEGMKYMNELLEDIAKKQGIPLPEIKPNIFRAFP